MGDGQNIGKMWQHRILLSKITFFQNDKSARENLIDMIFFVVHKGG